jgi:hypothetical protein
MRDQLDAIFVVVWQPHDARGMGQAPLGTNSKSVIDSRLHRGAFEMKECVALEVVHGAHSMLPHRRMAD